MKELETLKAALAPIQSPWKAVLSIDLHGHSHRRVYEGAGIVLDDGGIVLDDGGIGQDSLAAIVLSVNLAPLLVRVAEAAEALLGGDVQDIKGVVKVVALGDALTALRAAAQGAK